MKKETSVITVLKFVPISLIQFTYGHC